jgi:hypothetical protein
MTRTETLTKLRADRDELESTGIQAARVALVTAQEALKRAALAYADPDHETVRAASAAVTHARERAEALAARLDALRSEIERLDREQADADRIAKLSTVIAPKVAESVQKFRAAYGHAVALAECLAEACKAQHDAVLAADLSGEFAVGVQMFDPYANAAFGESTGSHHLHQSLLWLLHQKSDGLVRRPEGIHPPHRNLAQIEADWREQREQFARGFLERLNAPAEVLAMLDPAPAVAPVATTKSKRAA